MIVVNYYRPVITVVLIVSRSKTMKLQKIINDLHQSRSEWNGKSRIMRKTLIPCQTKAVSVLFSQIPLPSGWMIMMMIRESNTNHWIIRSNGIADNILNWSPKNWGGNNKSLEFSLGSSSFASWELRLRGLSVFYEERWGSSIHEKRPPTNELDTRNYPQFVKYRKFATKRWKGETIAHDLDKKVYCGGLNVGINHL